MQQAVQNTPSPLERHLTVSVPIAQIEAEIAQRLKKLARTVRMQGFRPGHVPLKMVERQYGYLEFHSRSTAAVQSATQAVLDALDASERDATRPTVLAAELVSRLDHQHAFLINRNKLGSMALPGESMFVLEMQPASYAILAVNEAEKAAHVSLVQIQPYGAFGRLWLSGSEAEIDAAAKAATTTAGSAATISTRRSRRSIRSTGTRSAPASTRT